MPQGNRRWWSACLATVLTLHFGPAPAVELDSLPEVTADTLVPSRGERRAPQYLFGFVGAGVFNTGRYLGGDERVSFPLPLVYFDYNDRVYWSIASVGGWLWRSDDRRFRLGLLAKARGAVRGADTGYAGIADRNASADAGINLVWNPRPLTIGLSWLGDIGDRSNGHSASLRLSKRMLLGGRWITTPGVVAEWLDDDLVDYYYGVTPAETGGGAPVYAGRRTTNLRAAWSLAYRLTTHWTLTGGVSYTKLGTGLDDSPLTARERNTLVFVGVGWSFVHFD